MPTDGALPAPPNSHPRAGGRPGSHGGAGYGRSVAPVKPLPLRPRSSSRQDWRLLVVAALLTVAAACGHKIGDSCGNSADCDPSTGARTCDISQPGGYCIIEGCDAGEVCLPDVNKPGTAACVRTSLEKRACAQTCGDSGDCRGGYSCRTVGTCGTLPLLLDPKGTAKFCAPTPANSAGAPVLCPA